MLTPEFASSFGRLTANHLWQSTAFAAVAVLLALALRANHARARYWLWLAASVKFLFPWAALAAIGAALGRWLIPATPAQPFPFVIEQIVQPFTHTPYPSFPSLPSAPSAPSLLPALLLSLWLCGVLAVLLYAWTRWRRVATAVRSATPLTQGRELKALRSVYKKSSQKDPRRSWWGRRFRLPSSVLSVVSSTAQLEPGVFGTFRPILFLPAGIANRLADAELEAILAHELCHIRRRDNLLATLHLLVESIFWFHPLVWWLGARLEEERERACDEEVVRMGGEPQIYAESILKVVEFYLASPVPCAAGVTGGDLKKRIEGIMTNRLTRKLSHGKKVLLAAAAVVAIAVPIAVGLIDAPRSSAQTPPGVAVPSAPPAQAAQSAAPPAAVTNQRPAQSADAAPPKVHAPLSFEVASVKIPAPGAAAGGGIFGCSGGPGSGDPIRWTCRSARLGSLILSAYNLKSYQFPRDLIVSIPSRPQGDEFDIDAKVPAGATPEQFRQMQQNLLKERLKLALHFEKKEIDGCELTVAKNGLKMKESQPPSDSAQATPPPAPPGPPARDRDGYPVLPAHPGLGLIMTGDGHVRMAGQNVPMWQLVSLLEGQARGPVSDATGLSGNYDVTLSWLFGPALQTEASAGGAPSAPEPDSLSSLFAAIQDQLGLKLQRKKVMVDFAVIDHVEKKPTEN